MDNVETSELYDMWEWLWFPI